jgi:hypothetical protein
MRASEGPIDKTIYKGRKVLRIRTASKNVEQRIRS